MKNPKKVALYSLLFCLFWAHNATAQQCAELNPTTSSSNVLAGLLGDEGQSITEACQLAKGDDYFTVRIDHQGFDDKEYVIIAQMLNESHRKVPGCERLKVPLEKGATSTDLTLRFEAAGKGLKVPHVEVRYLKITITEADDALADLGVSGLNLSGTTAEYRINHRFRVGADANGTSNVTVAVSFTPVGKAGSIKQ